MTPTARIGTLLVAAVTTATAIAQEFKPPVPMDTYVFGLLHRGPEWSPQRTPATDSIQAGHMANIRRMADEGVLMAAGPMLDGGDLRGVFVFRDDSLAKIRALADRDPAIQAGRLALDLHRWLAPAGIGKLYFQRWKQPGFRDSMVRYQLVLLRKGPKWSGESTPELQALQVRHVEHVFGLLLSGKAATAGPFLDDGDLAGIFVFRGDSATAAALAGADPTVKAGRLAVEQHPWIAAYGVMPGDSM